MYSRIIHYFSLSIILLVCPLGISGQTGDQPNVLFIAVDDLND
jgi:hypothetical protein